MKSKEVTYYSPNLVLYRDGSYMTRYLSMKEILEAHFVPWAGGTLILSPFVYLLFFGGYSLWLIPAIFLVLFGISSGADFAWSKHKDKKLLEMHKSYRLLGNDEILQITRGVDPKRSTDLVPVLSEPGRRVYAKPWKTPLPDPMTTELKTRAERALRDIQGSQSWNDSDSGIERFDVARVRSELEDLIKKNAAYLRNTGYQDSQVRKSASFKKMSEMVKDLESIANSVRQVDARWAILDEQSDVTDEQLKSARTQNELMMETLNEMVERKRMGL